MNEKQLINQIKTVIALEAMTGQTLDAVSDIQNLLLTYKTGQKFE